MCEFGFPKESLKKEIFQVKGNFASLGVAPVRIDFINQIDGGVEFNEAKNNRKRGEYDNQKVYFISKKDLIKNKSSTQSLQDKADVEKLTLDSK